jgi:hypothetical protein
MATIGGPGAIFATDHTVHTDPSVCIGFSFLLFRGTPPSQIAGWRIFTEANINIF